ncbi:MAG: hypothetical protein LQ344_007260 [Seirophora lacunosa]|nr:MAG: hypothetical protein LQ344_007260 [Seirophora lacunosa]
MESLAILGLAGNILQFLDFSGKIISGTLELYQSANGATSSNLVLENTSKDLVQLCAAMLPDLTSRSALTRSDSETALITLSESCRTLGQELLTVLEDLKVKGRRKRWQSARQALRSAWKARDVQRLESQLASYRSQIAARLLAILMYQIVDVLKSTSAHAGTNVAINRTEDNAVKLPAEISTWLSTVQSAGALLSKQIRILNNLKFPSLSEREENVKEAHPATFEWLFEPAANALTSTKPPRIFDWLIEGSGVFWVSGRAGSGKSTLMKFFYRNPKTVTALQQWAGTRKLVVANFFFWHAGTTMQKSQQGLLQTLLYHILQQDPSLIAAMCPSRWNQSASSMESWSYAEVLEVVERIKEQTLDSFRFCFFLDGLDEFEGDHMDIVSTINSLASSDAIKVCFSSRPWTVFENAYGPKTESVIRVHDLTQGDITRFVEDRLAEGTQFLKLKATAAAYGELVDEIRERSNGVFLWVYLVVRSLRRGMTNLDTVSELQKRLRELPVELEAYFQLMLDSTERVYHQQAARLYRVRLVAHIPPTVNDVWMFAEDDLDFALRDKYLDMPQPSFLATTKTRILARCQDLLEFDKHSQLQFLHRTVKDFLETRDMLSLLIKRAGAHFNPHHFMCNSMLLPMKQAAQSSELALPGYSNLSDF